MSPTNIKCKLGFIINKRIKTFYMAELGTIALANQAAHPGPHNHTCMMQRIQL